MTGRPSIPGQHMWVAFFVGFSLTLAHPNFSKPPYLLEAGITVGKPLQCHSSQYKNCGSLIFSFLGVTSTCGPGPPHFWGFTITLRHTPQSVGLLWTSYQSVAETSTWRHTTLTRDRRPCLRRYSNPQSQKASGRRHALDRAATGLGGSLVHLRVICFRLPNVALSVQISWLCGSC
jgi:hypothetical protein